MLFTRSAALAFVVGVIPTLFFLPVNASDDALKAQQMEFETVRLMKAGEDDKALVEVDKALKLPHGAMLEKRKADCLLNLGRTKEALDVAQGAAKKAPKNFEIHQTIAQIYDAMHMFDEALKELQIAVALKPDDRGVRSSREKIYEHLHEWAKAADDLTIVVKTSDAVNRPKPLERRAFCYMQLKEYSKAIADLSGALSGSAGRSDLMRLRAQAYEKIGNHAAAKKDLEAALALDGDFEPPATMGNPK